MAKRNIPMSFLFIIKSAITPSSLKKKKKHSRVDVSGKQKVDCYLKFFSKVQSEPGIKNKTSLKL